MLGNWIGLAASVVAGFFLGPFVVRHLGNTAYGVWTLVVSIASYMGLLDLGLRGAVVRFTSTEHARGDHAAASRSVSTALAIRAGIGVLIVALSGAVAAIAPALLNIPPDLAYAARVAILVVGLNVAVRLTFGVFAGVLTALHRFDLTGIIGVAQTIVRAVGVVVLLDKGYGIVALAVWELFAVCLGSAATYAATVRVYPLLRVGVSKFDRSLVRDYSTYSFWVFVTNLGQQVIYYSDNLIIGAFLNPAAVTFYAVGGTLLLYLRSLVRCLTSTFTPLASELSATGQDHRMGDLLIQGTRMTFLLALPIELALLFRGKTFIGLWMGPEYAQVSGTVLQLLLVAEILRTGTHTGTSMMYGVSKHQKGATWTAMEAVANLGLSVILVKRMGLFGVAWGTLIPSLAISVWFSPPYHAEIAGIPLRRLLWQGWIRPIAAAIPFAAACAAADRWWPAASLVGFGLQMIALLPVFAAGVAVVFWKELVWRFPAPGSWPFGLRTRPRPRSAGQAGVSR